MSQIKDIYEGIVRIIHLLHNSTDFRAKNVQDPYHSKISKQSTRQGGATTYSKLGHQNQGQIHQIQEDDDGPLPPPPQLPHFVSQSSSTPAPGLDSVIALLNNYNGSAPQQYQQHQHHQHHQQQSRRNQQRQVDAVIDENGDVTEFDNDDEMNQTDVERIHIAEWSYSRNPSHNTAAADEEQSEQQEQYPETWTIYDVIRHKFAQQETFRSQYNSAIMTPLANPPEPPQTQPGGPRRRGGGGRRGGPRQAQQPTQGFLDLDNGQRLQHALMSYEWKIEACRRRVQRYTEITDDLIIVFDAAQLEIYKLMERDSFARFVKTQEFREFMANHKFGAANSGLQQD